MTVTALTVVISVLVLAIAWLVLVFRAVPGVQAYLKLRRKRLVTCPQTEGTAAVEVAATEWKDVRAEDLPKTFST